MEPLLLALCIVVLLLLVRTRQDLRALRVRNRTLEAAAEGRSGFVAKVAHELRNPLSTVVGFTELMRAGRTGSLSDRQDEHLALIQESAEHMMALTDDLVDLSRVQAGHLRVSAAPVEPAAVIGGCVASLAHLAQAQEVAIELHAPPVGHVLLDPVRLRQVGLNYLSNAIKYTGPGGRVRVSLGREGEGLRLEVADSGSGIAPADQPRVFDEFFQVAGGKRAGTGLGLAVTKLIVEAQGGRVGLNSHLGQGSTFAAWLPVEEPAAPAKRQVRPRPELRIQSAACARA